MSISSLERRLADLEKRISVEPIRLSMLDGSTFLITDAGGNYAPRLIQQAQRLQDLGEPLTAELQAIRDCVEIFEPGGSHILALVQVFLLGEKERGKHAESIFDSE